MTASDARGGRPGLFHRLTARATAQTLSAFVVPEEEFAVARGIDLKAAGLKVVVNPRHASVLLIIGDLPKELAKAAAIVYAQMLRPKAIVTIGSQTDELVPLLRSDVRVGFDQEALAGGVKRLRMLFASAAWTKGAPASQTSQAEDEHSQMGHNNHSPQPTTTGHDSDTAPSNHAMMHHPGPDNKTNPPASDKGNTPAQFTSNANHSSDHSMITASPANDNPPHVKDSRLSGQPALHHAMEAKQDSASDPPPESENKDHAQKATIDHEHGKASEQKSSILDKEAGQAGAGSGMAHNMTPTPSNTGTSSAHQLAHHHQTSKEAMTEYSGHNPSMDITMDHSSPSMEMLELKPHFTEQGADEDVPPGMSMQNPKASSSQNPSMGHNQPSVEMSEAEDHDSSIMNMEGMDHSAHHMDMGGMNHSGHMGMDMEGMDHSGHMGMDHGGRSFMSMVAMTKDLPRSPDGLPMEWVEAPFGPLFAGLRAGLSLMFTLDGERVAQAKVTPGPLKRGLEARWPGPLDTFPERLAWLNPLTPVAYEMLARKAIEQALGKVVDEATQLEWVAALERERAINHLGWLAKFGKLLGSQQLAEQASDLELALVRSTTLAGIKSLRSDLEKLVRNWQKWPFVKSRLAGVACLQKAATQWPGPVTRAGGNEIDARNNDPVYARFGFRPVFRPKNDALARLEVRLAELEQSFELISAIEIRTASVEVVHPRSVGATVSGMASIETPRGTATLTVYIEQDRVSEVKLETPSTHYLELLGPVAEGQDVADALVGIASLDLSGWELDR